MFLVVGRVGTTLGDPWDIAEDAVRRAYEPTAPFWDREKKSLAKYLGSFANSMVANGLKKLETKSSRPLEHADLADAVYEGDSPEEIVSHRQALQRTGERMAKIREAVKDDPCCVALVDATLAGEPKPFRGRAYSQAGRVGRCAHTGAIRSLRTPILAAEAPFGRATLPSPLLATTVALIRPRSASPRAPGRRSPAVVSPVPQATRATASVRTRATPIARRGRASAPDSPSAPSHSPAGYAIVGRLSCGPHRSRFPCRNSPVLSLGNLSRRPLSSRG